ncbi:hypothetical protein C8F01DRAFT_1209555 [Mycena amicta]|nr:hypothetical protein C8F01DRAFT_1209555 [Mycena amicta]
METEPLLTRPPRSPREKTAKFLESRPFHTFVLFLGPALPGWLAILSHTSLGITTFFLLEIPLTLWSFGPRFYIPGCVDHAIVLRGKEQELAGLLIILRLWRLLKLVGGVSVGVGELGEADAIRAAEAENHVERLKKENAELRARLAEAGVR